MFEPLPSPQHRSHQPRKLLERPFVRQRDSQPQPSPIVPLQAFTEPILDLPPHSRGAVAEFSLRTHSPVILGLLQISYLSRHEAARVTMSVYTITDSILIYNSEFDGVRSRREGAADLRWGWLESTKSAFSAIPTSARLPAVRLIKRL